MFVHGRRVFLKQMGMAAGTMVLLPYLSACGAAKPVTEEVVDTPVSQQGHTLPELPYAYDALVPHVDAMTMEIHHSKHHAAYVNNLNKALELHPELASLPLTALLAADLVAVPEDIRTAVRNNGGGHLNHAIFWKMMTPGGGGAATGPLGDAIQAKWGSFDAFKAEFKKAALGQFGSGWAWLVKTPLGELAIVGTPEQETPWSDGHLPVLGVDVWEHAYYLNYENRRGDYVDAFFNVINWAYAQDLFLAPSPEAWAALA